MTRSLLPLFFVIVSASGLVTPTSGLTAPTQQATAVKDFQRMLSPITPRRTRKKLLDNIRTMRQSRFEKDAFNSYMDAIANHLDNAPAPPVFLASSARLPFPFVSPSSAISRRTQVQLFKKLLSLSGDESTQTVEDKRLAIAINLNSMGRGGVYSRYREARRRAARALTMDEMLSRTPKDLETPKYAVVMENLAKPGFEIRRYESYSVCETNAKGPKGFGVLAGYIFGKNKQERSMAMTTPVFMERDKDSPEGVSVRMQFVMGSEYWADEDKLKNEAPEPLEGADVTKTMVPERTVAVVYYGGLSGRGEVKKRESELIEILEANNLAVADGARFQSANYNDPFTRPSMRRNEVMIEIVGTTP